MIPMIVRVWCESGAGWAPTPVPVTPHTTCRDVLDCCREPGDEPCLLFSVHPIHGVHVLRDTELPLEVASALGPDVQFVLKYIEAIVASRYKASDVLTESRVAASAAAGPKRNLEKVGQHSLKIKWMGRRNQFFKSASVGNDELGIYGETGLDNRSEEIDH
ncbi:unnamed protein product [Chrysodeixis includens]|uniref:Apoptosis-stimulating of p53 protein 2-like RA domain-containing protein n=1 Tax=Chrysodeixis includens TaxID=689277 RepID=A0A9N8KTJ3_CHRIL|nr:unnamed protein product [Chrysodeixis includens]